MDSLDQTVRNSEKKLEELESRLYDQLNSENKRNRVLPTLLGLLLFLAVGVFFIPPTKHEDVVDALAKAEQLIKENDNTKSNLEQLSGSLKSAKDYVEGLSGVSKTIDEKIDNFYSQVKSVGDLDSEFRVIEAQVPTLVESQKKLERTIRKISARISKFGPQKKIDPNMKADLARQKGQINRISALLESTTQDIKKFRQELASLETRLGQLDTAGSHTDVYQSVTAPESSTVDIFAGTFGVIRLVVGDYAAGQLSTLQVKDPSNETLARALRPVKLGDPIDFMHANNRYRLIFVQRVERLHGIADDFLYFQLKRLN